MSIADRAQAARRLWWIRSGTSAQIFTGSLDRLSSVSAIRPSVEFSSGTTPKWEWPAATSSKAAEMLATGTKSTELPNRCSAARWL